MNTHISPFQLFFISFFYVFSGITLAGADAVLTLLIPFAVFSLWTLIGCMGCMKKRNGLSEFFSVYLPKKGVPFALVFFIICASAELVYLLMDAGSFFRMGADFISFPLILGVLLGIALISCKGGMTGIGRFAEMLLFLLVPLIVLHLFGRFKAPELFGEASVIRLLFSVMPAPIFFCLSHTAVPGDQETSQAFRLSGNVPKNRAFFLFKITIGGAASAVLFRLFLMVFPFDQASLLRYFLEYGAHAVKISLLTMILFREIPSHKKGLAHLYAGAAVFALIFTLAVWSGAFFSPFLWMLILMVSNVAVCLFLGIVSSFFVV